MAELIDKTYGEALFQLSLEEGKVEQYADEVRSIKEAIAENPEFMVLLDHPQITREEKVEVMRNCLDGRASDSDRFLCYRYSGGKTAFSYGND